MSKTKNKKTAACSFYEKLGLGLAAVLGGGLTAVSIMQEWTATEMMSVIGPMTLVAGGLMILALIISYWEKR